MIRVILGRGDNPRAVSLSLPITPAELGEAFAKLDAISTRYCTVMTECNSPVDGLCQYVRSIDLDSDEEFAKLNQLAEKISAMSEKQSWVFSGALAQRLDEYERVPDDPAEYGKAVLERLGAHKDIIDAIDGHIGFDGFGELSITDRHVVRTEFGLIERKNPPFAEQQYSMKME